MGFRVSQADHPFAGRLVLSRQRQSDAERAGTACRDFHQATGHPGFAPIGRSQSGRSEPLLNFLQAGHTDGREERVRESSSTRGASTSWWARFLRGWRWARHQAGRPTHRVRVMPGSWVVSMRNLQSTQNQADICAALRHEEYGIRLYQCQHVPVAFCFVSIMRNGATMGFTHVCSAAACC